jgi:hypothetical protein
MTEGILQFQYGAIMRCLTTEEFIRFQRVKGENSGCHTRHIIKKARHNAGPSLFLL